jgi:hypothetical protein
MEPPVFSKGRGVPFRNAAVCAPPPLVGPLIAPFVQHILRHGCRFIQTVRKADGVEFAVSNACVAAQTPTVKSATEGGFYR